MTNSQFPIPNSTLSRYFIELAYKGTNYAGFQVQQNANTIQAEMEKALKTYFRQGFELTGSSRTDAGVHAAQNWFHFDTELVINAEAAEKPFTTSMLFFLQIS